MTGPVVMLDRAGRGDDWMNDAYLHGTSQGWDHGCRCALCARRHASDRIRHSNAAKREARDGLPPRDDEPHNASTYANKGCRCATCTSANAKVANTARLRRYAARAEIDGRMVATEAPEHGTESTYSNWGCRCSDCSEAKADYTRWIRENRKKKS